MNMRQLLGNRQEVINSVRKGSFVPRVRCFVQGMPTNDAVRVFYRLLHCSGRTTGRPHTVTGIDDPLGRQRGCTDVCRFKIFRKTVAPIRFIYFFVHEFHHKHLSKYLSSITVTEQVPTPFEANYRRWTGRHL